MLDTEIDKDPEWIGAGTGNGGKPGLDFSWDTEWGKTRTGFQLGHGMGENPDWISAGIHNGGRGRQGILPLNQIPLSVHLFNGKD